MVKPILACQDLVQILEKDTLITSIREEEGICMLIYIVYCYTQHDDDDARLLLLFFGLEISTFETFVDESFF